MYSTAAIPEFRGQEKRQKSLEKSFMQAEVPFAGSWISPKASPILSGELNPNFAPAGLRIPKSLKLAFTEKIPKYMEVAQKSQRNSDQRQILKEWQKHLNEKYGNRSRIG